jgi:hypothetical protein
MSLQVVIMEVASSLVALMHCHVITTLLRVVTMARVSSWMIVVSVEERELLVAQMSTLVILMRLQLAMTVPVYYLAVQIQRLVTTMLWRVVMMVDVCYLAAPILKHAISMTTQVVRMVVALSAGVWIRQPVIMMQM